MKQDRQKKRGSSIVVTLIVIIAIGVLAYCMYQLVPKFIEYKVSDDAFNRIRNEAVQELKPVNKPTFPGESDDDESEEMEEPADLSNALQIDWDAFEGTDIVAWIQLDDISYPIMQADDNDAYLHHLPDGSYNYGGSIFLYNHNNPLFTDQSSFVYGHNMANGSMFGTLKKYADAGYVDHCFYIYLPDGTRRTYRFFSIASVSESSQAYTWSFASDESFVEWQKWMKEHSIYGNSPQVGTDKKYVTLSTCNGYAGTDHRLIVCGQLERIDEIQEPASWYDAYMAKYSDELLQRQNRADEIRTHLNQLQQEARTALWRERMGFVVE